MRGKKVKLIRKQFRKANIAISAEPYSRSGTTVYASRGRRGYQKLKDKGI